MIAPKETRSQEGRGQPKGNLGWSAKVRTQGRGALPSHLVWVNEAARRNKGAQFTALLHHMDVAALERAFRRLKRAASAGVDGMTVAEYEKGLEERLQDLHERLHSGRYRPKPARRSYIPKADGSRRELGIPAMEDKILQGAMAEILSAIYETDFLGFSYGFRPGRSPHMALDALRRALMTQKVNWVLDADIRNFFPSVSHEWVLRMLAYRIADRRVLRLICQWLKAGVWENGQWTETVEGTPQGSGISPLLSNIFLHYVLDQWTHVWRRRCARGQVIIVRWADDFVMGFQHKEDGVRMLAALKERLGKFSLALHEGKTRLIEFGRFAAERRVGRKERRPETFAFLGFTHYCGKSREGYFVVKRETMGRRMTRKLKELRSEAKRRMHESVYNQHLWLVSVLNGHYRYYGVPGNIRRMRSFHWEVWRLWLRVLRRRGHKHRMNVERYRRLLVTYPLPVPRICHGLQPLLA